MILELWKYYDIGYYDIRYNHEGEVNSYDNS